MEALFEKITRIIASPHSTITEHDKLRAMQVFIAFDDYLIDNLHHYNEDDAIDFGAYVGSLVDEEEGK